MKSHPKYCLAVCLATAVCCFRTASAESDPCSLLTPAQVSAVLETNVEAARHVAPRLCQWSASNQPNSMNGKKVTLLLKDARSFQFAKTPVMPEIKTMAAPGICDDAVYTVTPGVSPGLGTALYVKKGDSYFAVQIYGSRDQPRTMALEKTLAVEACSKL